MSTSKSHMYTANVWCCNMLNIIDVTCIQQMCDVVICEYNRCLCMYTANVWCCNMLI